MNFGGITIATYNAEYTSLESHDVSVRPGGKGDMSATVGSYTDAEGAHRVVICVYGGALLPPAGICEDGLLP